MIYQTRQFCCKNYSLSMRSRFLKRSLILLLFFRSATCPSIYYLQHSAGSVLNTTTTGIDTVIHVTCKTGFWLPRKSSLLKCNFRGQWTPKPVPCKPIFCPAKSPGLSLLPQKNSSSVKNSTLMEYKCNEGFRLSLRRQQNSSSSEPKMYSR